MTDEKEKQDLAWKAVGGLVGFATAWAAKKVLSVVWEKTTGKKPPADHDSLDVSLAEAIGYAVVMGVGMQVAQIVMARTARRRYDAWRALKDAARDVVD
ncbi:DUF4235 domain-containing protein [Planomonospora sp. ID91781]|uniref:DUF4235 domain-containing protein n=3 Tax=Planomonospora TaxID=1998 RepID=A0A161LJZ9_9ACTN|nr:MULTISPECIES: DUF4235 domain-containing protein [Planomonospora]MBG0824463.1 DUF4235 domain-containing protein [Planomonospora sp. ID91781]GAT66137.1 hypothetical protein PS9374_01781 [Planomonospora sphaerica]GGK85774.1 hypothetical protein GCM10010126_51240 [Planomonospora parontospora]GII10738.1 hypothetical protein Ppa06_45360 [Planomonospora parontospora subsp. parontospora]